MPRPCAVEAHARSYKRTLRKFADATALRRGGSRLLLKLRSSLPKTSSVKLHGARPWHLRELCLFFVAASVKLHGARPWHLRELCLFFVAASVKLHGARPWHHLARSLKTGGFAIHCPAFIKLVDLAKSLLLISRVLFPSLDRPGRGAQVNCHPRSPAFCEPRILHETAKYQASQIRTWLNCLPPI